jgi:hypothetical protein
MGDYSCRNSPGFSPDSLAPRRPVAARLPYSGAKVSIKRETKEEKVKENTFLSLFPLNS